MSSLITTYTNLNYINSLLESGVICESESGNDYTAYDVSPGYKMQYCNPKLAADVRTVKFICVNKEHYGFQFDDNLWDLIFEEPTAFNVADVKITTVPIESNLKVDADTVEGKVDDARGAAESSKLNSIASKFDVQAAMQFHLTKHDDEIRELKRLLQATEWEYNKRLAALVDIVAELQSIIKQQ